MNVKTPAETTFTLFHVAPTLKPDEGASPGFPQHCTRGHAWNFGFALSGVTLDLSSWGLTDGEERFCLHCLRDRLREHCGRVKDGTKGGK